MILVLRWVLNALALILVSYLVPGVIVAGFYSALIAALLLGFANAIIRPILLLLTLPINLLTLGLFTFVVNAAMILLVSSIVKGFEVESFSVALLAAVLLWFIGWITNTLFEPDIRNTK